MGLVDRAARCFADAAAEGRFRPAEDWLEVVFLALERAEAGRSWT